MAAGSPDVCPSCGAALPAGSPRGLCPVCVTQREQASATTSPVPVAGDPGITQTYEPRIEPRAPDSDSTAIHDPVATLPEGAVVRYFGDYEIRRELGRGGMGVVYQARQLSLNRSVALKMLRHGLLADGDERRRFQNEAEAVARLDHPGIVPVYEVGSHDGQPYFSMKLVEGGSLVPGLERYNEDPRAAARLVMEGALAVHHAHQRGILHRDLKPGNILVDDEGRPHITDFGLAKHVEADGEQTASGAILGTPAYMSPEQASGRRGSITTATDIYGLGTVLYALVTGRAPFGGDSVVDTLEAVRARPPDPPSRVNSRVPRDLETICLKCLEKDPRRRYASAHALAEDLRNWLDSRPITARRTGAAERAWLWCRRNPAVAALSMATVLALVGGTATTIAVQARSNAELRKANTSLEMQRRRAQDREQHAIGAVKRFRDAVFESSELKNNPSLGPLRKTLLQEPLVFFKSLREQLQNDRDTRPEALERLATAARELALLNEEIGNREDALQAHAESRAVRERLVRENPDSAKFQYDLAVILHDLGALQSETGRPAEAMDSDNKAREILEQLARANPQNAVYQSQLAGTLHNIGNLQRVAGQTSEAMKSFSQALEMQERLARAQPDNEKTQRDVALTLANIGILQNETGQPQEALASFLRSLEIREQIATKHKNTENDFELGLSHYDIENVYAENGRTEDALASNDQARTIFERLARENPSNTNVALFVARTYHGRGMLQRNTGRQLDALASYNDAQEILERLVRDNPSTTAFQRGLAALLSDSGILKRALGRPDEALASYKRAREIREQLVRENPDVVEFQSGLAKVHHNTGFLLRLMGRLPESLEAHAQALEIRQRLAREHPDAGDLHLELASSHTNIGNVQFSMGKNAEAIASYEIARTITDRLARENPTVTNYRLYLADCYNDMSLAQKALGNLAEALESIRRATEIYARLANENPTVTGFQRDTATGRHNTGDVLLAMGRADDALESFTQARETRERLAREEPSLPELQGDLASTIASIAAARLGQGRPAEALASYAQSREIRERLARENPHLPELAAELGGVLSSMASIDMDAKNWEHARPLLENAIRWRRKALDASPTTAEYRRLLSEDLDKLIKAAEALGNNDAAAQARRELEELIKGAPSP